MKIKSDIFLNFAKNNSSVFKFILLYGPNIGLVNILFNNVINILSINVNDPFNVSKFSAQNLQDNPYVILDTISTFSMSSDRRVVLLDLCNISLKKNIIEDILKSISTKLEDYLIIIKADNLGSQNELVKYIQNSKIGVLVPCYEESSNQIKYEISNILKSNNFNFSDSFIFHLSEKFSNDSSINRMEFDKLKTFLINNQNITESTLLNLITDNTNINLNKVTNYCAIGDIKNALFFYDKALESSISPIVIIRNMVKHFKLIEKVLCAVQDGISVEDAINKIKPSIFFKDKPIISFQIQLWNLQKINLILKRLSDIEIKCKSGVFSDKLLTSQLILSMSVMAKNAIKP